VLPWRPGRAIHAHMDEDRPPHEVTFQFISEPSTVNYGGKVHGGAVLKWIDQAAYTCARSYAQGYCVTAYLGGTHFKSPIGIGDLVTVHARVIDTGRTSIHIAVDVEARSFEDAAFTDKVHCVAVFVHVDENGRPQPVPPWAPRTDAERRAQAHARRLRACQVQMDDALRQEEAE
jgi:acyl-CoA hydrolase